MRILVVDDEPDLCEILCFNLESEGFEAECAHSAESALALIGSGQRFDLILLDVMMEAMSGYEMARQLRAAGDNTPIIFLTALNAEADQLKGFGAGADDYITKPFSFPTVLARIYAVLKRSRQSVADEAEILRYGALEVDFRCKAVALDGNPVPLTRKEFSILELLVRHQGEHFTREQIIDEVWEDNTYVTDRSVDVHIARLRKKLGPCAAAIVNHSGFGYTFIHNS